MAENDFPTKTLGN
jgi:hypothetical protein